MDAARSEVRAVTGHRTPLAGRSNRIDHDGQGGGQAFTCRPTTCASRLPTAGRRRVMALAPDGCLGVATEEWKRPRADVDSLFNFYVDFLLHSPLLARTHMVITSSLLKDIIALQDDEIDSIFIVRVHYFYGSDDILLSSYSNECVLFFDG